MSATRRSCDGIALHRRGRTGYARRRENGRDAVSRCALRATLPGEHRATEVDGGIQVESESGGSPLIRNALRLPRTPPDSTVVAENAGRLLALKLAKSPSVDSQCPGGLT